jgi:hypothetical protein
MSNYYVIQPLLPELDRGRGQGGLALTREYSACDDLLSFAQTRAVLEHNGLCLRQRA